MPDTPEDIQADIQQAGSGGPDFTPKEWPTMPDTPKDEAIRRAAESTQPEVSLAVDGWMVVSAETLGKHEQNLGELIQLRAHLDALTAAVEALPVRDAESDMGSFSYIDRAAVLAILRGTPADPDAEAEAEFLKPIKPQGL